MLIVLALLLVILIALVVLLLSRQPDRDQPQLPARLDPEDTARIVTELRSNLAQVQGEIQKVGVEQLVNQNQAVLKTETVRGEEQLKARQSEIDKGLTEVRQELGKLRELVRDVDSKRG